MRSDIILTQRGVAAFSLLEMHRPGETAGSLTAEVVWDVGFRLAGSLSAGPIWGREAVVYLRETASAEAS